MTGDGRNDEDEQTNLPIPSQLTTEEKVLLKQLRRRRGTIAAQLTNYEKTLTNYTTGEHKNQDLLEVQFESIQNIWEKFDQIQSDIEEILPAEETKRFDLQARYFFLLAETRKALRNNGVAVQSTVSTDSSPHTSPITVTEHSPAVKLPPIPLPTFDGTYEQWAPFFDLFQSIIHGNPSLSSVQKLQYLRAAVQGKAAKTIESLETTDKNYDDAIKLLKDKFECSRKVIRRHWMLLKEIPRLNKDTPEAIGNLIDNFRQHVRALENLGEPVATWDTPLIDLILSKISPDTVFQWELNLSNNSKPKYTELIDFLEKRANCFDLLSIAPANSNKGADKTSRKALKTQAYHLRKDGGQTPQCALCSEAHKIYVCPKFASLTVNERRKEVNQANLCFNCMSRGHRQDKCPSKLKCRTCQAAHHSMLHVDSTVFSIEISAEELTPTVVLLARSKTHRIPCRAILDTGSTANFVTERFATLLQLDRSPCSIPIGALNGLHTLAQSYVTATITSRYNNYQKTLEFLIIPTISALTPAQQINRSSMKIPANIQLADPNFHKPAPIDMLIGTGTSLSVLSVGQIKLTHTPGMDIILQKTVLGWIIAGSISPGTKNISCHLNILPNDLSKFWEIEELPSAKNFSLTEQRCEEHFVQNFTRTQDGRYIVALPFNEKKNQLGTSRARALKRLLSLENKLDRDLDLKNQYREVIEEYITLGHMERVPDDEEGFYLPHHAVIKASSMTTKLRVVFDGSAETSTGVSLNDALDVGPTIQSDLFSILLRFRLHNFVITGDIEKMYRQVLVKKEDRKYQKILWRDKDGNISTYELKTVTFGLAPAPFLAVRSVHQLIKDEGTTYLKAATTLESDLYMDDFLSGASTIQDTIRLRDEVIELLQRGGFHMRQFASNSAKILKGLPTANINLKLQLGEEFTLKTLGIFWDSRNDSITYSVKNIDNPSLVTKRFILSEIAKIFDPLGLVNPVTVYARLLTQELWRLRLDWDESVPLEQYTRWTEFATQLSSLNQFRLDRKVLHLRPVNRQLHGYCDASQSAYGACLYLRSTDTTGAVHTALYCSKSRVAPIKNPQTIPRLELCAALLLSELYTTIRSTIDLHFDQVVFWTDSTITLHWINTPPHLLKTFIANRVTQIQRNTNPKQWRHVRTADNPADALSRGQLPDKFLKNELWINGPEWLRQSENQWPVLKLSYPAEIQEAKRVTCLLSQQSDKELFHTCSSFSLLIRAIARCLRWRKPVKNNTLQVEELQEAHHRLIQWVQGVDFLNEISDLTKRGELSPKNKLINLSPFVDSRGILRVGGRLQRSTLTTDQRHPILLPQSHHITQLIIERAHLNGFHSGVQATLYHLRQKYWIINGRNQVRKVIRNCVRCTRVNPRISQHIMGQLPAVRVTEARPFLNVGVDYCGPFFIKEKKVRNRATVKTYAAIFICLVTKAVHIEIASDLTTGGFLAALRRMWARRGRSANIYSDNGTNFVGASNELKELYVLFQSQKHNEAVQQHLADLSVKWHFNPPYSPHFGGIWEAAVKSFKHHLKRVAGNNLFTFEQFNTLAIEIEAILNSRPLTPLSSDPNDLLVLTPSQFLIGDSLTNLPEQDFTDTPTNRLSTWQHIQKVKQDFWKRWSKEYINELNTKSKWATTQPSIKPGSIVVIQEDHLPPLQWKLGRIIETILGVDGVARVVKVKTAHGEITRAVRRIAPLPIET